MVGCMDNLYIARTWLEFGMGSNWDENLVTEENLRRIIKSEVEKYRSGSRFYSRMYTGTTGDEVFCDSEDINEVVEDVIRKRLSSSSTYSKNKDLVKLPSDHPVTIKQEHYENTIFRVFNEFGYKRDVIAGEADFTRYFLDLRNYPGDRDVEELGLKGGIWHEFTSYDLKNVLTCEFGFLFNPMEYLKAERDKIERLEARKNGKVPEHKHDGKYIDEILPEIATDEWTDGHIKEAKATIEKVTEYFKSSDPKDEYLDHMYDGHYDRERHYEFYRSIEEDRKIDHVKGLLYGFALADIGFGCTRTNRRDEEISHCMTYGELFKKGDDYECLAAFYGGSAEKLEDLKYMNAKWLLGYVFGYC